MFPPNAPHVEVKQGLLAILPNFKGQENENPYVHVRTFEEVISSFYWGWQMGGLGHKWVVCVITHLSIFDQFIYKLIIHYPPNSFN